MPRRILKNHCLVLSQVSVYLRLLNYQNHFQLYYENHYLVSSLNGKSLYFLRLNKNSQKIISLEKVFVGNRIRDIKVFQGNRSILLALEENGEIGILSNN